MKLERKKNALKGSAFGIVLKLYQVLMPFVLRTIFIYTLGVEYLGLNSLFTSIIQVLNIAELGVGSALVFSMYKPISENDTTKICALMKLYKIYYRIIGTIVLVIGLIITPFLQYLIKSDLPSDTNLYILYFLNLFTTVFSYWLFAYKNSLFLAHQRNDITSIITIVIFTIRYILQALCLLFLKNYYAYLLITLFSQILINLVTAFFANKFYPNLQARGNIDYDTKKEVNQKVLDLFASKIGQVVNNSFDTIVISSFLGLSTLTIYQNYFYIITSLIAIFSIIYKSCLAGVGNSIILETEEKNYTDFKKLSYIILLLLNFSIPCLLCLYQPFMFIWVGEELMLSDNYLIFFALYFYTYEIMALIEFYKDAAGSWHKDRFRPIIGAIINLVLNLVLINFIGLYGVLISTIISFVIVNIPWIYHRLLKDIFPHQKYYDYMLYLFKSLLIMILTTILCVVICKSLAFESNIVNFFVYLIICTVISFLIYFLGTFRSKEFYYYKIKLTKIITRRK
ncbi:MAG: oligosaccharide flippase family protein [Bacilli bacterium]|jgi:O-antigen/teichoic acid export membrane protein|nr:oligosaccharide flippase family protein [Bacilli bacterium]